MEGGDVVRVWEMWKRKRKLEEGAEREVERYEDKWEAFQRSKKTVRSPVGMMKGRKMEMMESIKR